MQITFIILLLLFCYTRRSLGFCRAHFLEYCRPLFIRLGIFKAFFKIPDLVIWWCLLDYNKLPLSNKPLSFSIKKDCISCLRKIVYLVLRNFLICQLLIFSSRLLGSFRSSLFDFSLYVYIIFITFLSIYIYVPRPMLTIHINVYSTMSCYNLYVIFLDNTYLL